MTSFEAASASLNPSSDPSLPMKEYLALLSELDRRRRTNRLQAYKPYRKQAEFHAAGATNRERLFTPGLFARLKLVGSGRYRATLILDRAIGTDQDKKFVLIVKPDSTVDYRPIQIGRLIDGLRIVTGGLVPGDRIVVNGLQRVRPGMKVTPTVTAMIPDSAMAIVRR